MSTLIERETVIDHRLGSPYSVILFDDDHHTMDEVVSQIIKATGYDSQRAYEIMMEAHSSGRAIVYTGHLERCEHIESILAQIRLSTKIESV